MKHFINGFLLATIAFSSTYSLARSTDANEVYIVVHGGYGSCGKSGEDAGYDPLGMSFFEIFQTSLQKIRNSFEGIEVKFIASCFEGNFDSPPGTNSYYKSSDDLERLQYIQSGDFGTVLAEEGIDKDTPVYFIGHSYGAWTMMNVAMQSGHQFNIRGLYTLDPIGPNDCSPWGAVWGSEGCFQAPTDLDNSLIAEQTVEWINFFQDTDMWLQSSKINEADLNWHVPYEDGEGHRMIDSDERVWSEILASMLKNL